MQLKRSIGALSICLVCLFVGFTSGAGQATNQCASLQLQQQVDGTGSSAPLFPTDNTARSVGGRELHMLLSSADHANSRKLVLLFYLAGDPPSVAIMPVFKCLAAFFDEEVQFLSVAYSELSLMALMSQGLHALPVLQVNAQGRRYRYSGKHWLQPMLHWVARALAQEPVVGLDVAQFCSTQQQLPTGGPPSTCRPHRSLADAYEASRGPSDRCDRRSTCRREWECGRWDGEVTLEELRAQRPAPLFYISLGFLVLRMSWLAHRWWFRRRSEQQAALTTAAPPAPAQAAVPAAQAGLGGG